MLQFTCPVCDGGPWDPVVVDSPTDSNSADETLGSKPKFWLTHGDDTLLFKFVRRGNDAPPGEDWAECAVHLIAHHLGLPSACVALATCNARRGSISKSFTRNILPLTHGNELLAAKIINYDLTKSRDNPLHTIANVRTALVGYSAGASFPQWDAFDLLATYLVLDTLVAGTDRHHENWGILIREENAELAPSFDHGNALGFAERPDRVARMLAEPSSIQQWVRRGKNRYFFGKPRLIELAEEAIRLSSSTVAPWMVDRLGCLDIAAIESTLSRIPQEIMSVDQRRFAIAVLAINQRRLLDALSG